jgi:hypothetical protein
MVLTTNFQMQNCGKVSNYGQIISVNCYQMWNLFILKSQYTTGVLKLLQYINAKSSATSVS